MPRPEKSVFRFKVAVDPCVYHRKEELHETKSCSWWPKKTQTVGGMLSAQIDLGYAPHFYSQLLVAFGLQAKLCKLDAN